MSSLEIFLALPERNPLRLYSGIPQYPEGRWIFCGHSEPYSEKKRKIIKIFHVSEDSPSGRAWRTQTSLTWRTNINQDLRENERKQNSKINLSPQKNSRRTLIKARLSHQQEISSDPVGVHHFNTQNFIETASVTSLFPDV